MNTADLTETELLFSLEIGSANNEIPVTEPAMPRKKGTKCVPRDLCKTIYNMHCVGVRVGAIAKYYKMKRPTAFTIQ